MRHAIALFALLSAFALPFSESSSMSCLAKERNCKASSLTFCQCSSHLKSSFLSKPFPATCFAGYTICVIGADGNIFPCFDFLEQNRAVGNVKKVSLKEFWWSKDYDEMRRATAKCRDCYLTCHQEFNLLYKFTGKVFSG